MTTTIRHAVPPPSPPTDHTASALFIPLSKVGLHHIGRKLRLVVQLLSLDPTSTHAIVTTTSPGRPTLLVDMKILFRCTELGTRIPEGWWTSDTISTRIVDGAKVPRLPLNFVPGEWITVVGWLEPSDLATTVGVPPEYTPPLDAVLECIHVSMSREPPVGAVCRGELG